MSTFNGLVDEFPDIRIDHFRTHIGRPPPAACFLSHVHSDHLLGLESLKMPFVYCSAVTRSILLRMEKYPHRINFQRGILEFRRQTYRHLKSILRSLPLETPIELELKPHYTIRITLFDANHCPGAVMFLMEGDGKAILYTGDVRAESWWVNSIVRNPVLLPFMYGHKHLDCVYLDTTFASHEDIYKNFPSKAEGLKELLKKIDKCPPDSIFYFRAWTLGYEDAWLALANFLGARVHVDDYQLGLYAACAEDGIGSISPLVGAQVGNSMHPGCLSNDVNAAIHSCEPGMECHAGLKKASNVVWIIPIISRSQNGTELAEVGAGGSGFGDLHQVSVLEHVDETSVQALRTFCNSIFDKNSQMQQIEAMIKTSLHTGTLNIQLDGLGLNQDDEIILKDFISLLFKRNPLSRDLRDASGAATVSRPRIIHFPFSRHSSLVELRDFISRFCPRDICPCTIDIATWTEEVSMESLFGDLCSEKTFKHDAETRAMVSLQRPDFSVHTSNRKRKRKDYDSQETASQVTQDLDHHRTAWNKLNQPPEMGMQADKEMVEQVVITINDVDDNDDDADLEVCHAEKIEEKGSVESASGISLPDEVFVPQESQDTMEANLDASDQREKIVTRRNAYHAAKTCLLHSEPWRWDDLHLRSLGWKGHTEEEIIL